MITTTTDHIEGHKIAEYIGIVSGESIAGTSLFKDFFAGIRDVIGGRSGGYQRVFKQCTAEAFADAEEMAREAGADAIVGMRFAPVSIGGDKLTMLGVTVTGTAVRLKSR